MSEHAQIARIAAIRDQSAHRAGSTTRMGMIPTHERAMRVSCLINHYNYGAFIGEAVASVLGQTRVPDEVILVDDGSAEPHLSRVREAARTSSLVRLVEKPNGGQLSCFESGMAASSGDVLLFLDADDRWRPEYVASVLELLARRPEVGFVVSNHALLSAGKPLIEKTLPSRDLGYSVALCLGLGGAWVGGPTSCLAVRRNVLDAIFPVPNRLAWRVCADEVLVYGASMVGARMYFLGQPLVDYRVHDENAFYGKRDSPERCYGRRLEGRRLVEHLRIKLSLPATLCDIAHYEFRTIEKPTREEYDRYWRAVANSTISFRKKMAVLTALFRAYHFPRG